MQIRVRHFLWPYPKKKNLKDPDLDPTIGGERLRVKAFENSTGTYHTIFFMYRYTFQWICQLFWLAWMQTLYPDSDPNLQRALKSDSEEVNTYPQQYQMWSENLWMDLFNL